MTSFSNTQIVATLPANTKAGTYAMIVANSIGESNGFDLTNGKTLFPVQNPSEAMNFEGMQKCFESNPSPKVVFFW